MTREEELLVEQVIGAHRERGVDGEIYSSPAWHDLSDQTRSEAFELTVQQREFERALDADGLSSTVKALLERIRTSRGA